MTTLGQHLETIRESRGLSMESVAAELRRRGHEKIGKSHIWGWENGSTSNRVRLGELLDAISALPVEAPVPITDEERSTAYLLLAEGPKSNASAPTEAA